MQRTSKSVHEQLRARVLARRTQSKQSVPGASPVRSRLQRPAAVPSAAERPISSQDPIKSGMSIPTFQHGALSVPDAGIPILACSRRREWISRVLLAWTTFVHHVATLDKEDRDRVNLDSLELPPAPVALAIPNDGAVALLRATGLAAGPAVQQTRGDDFKFKAAAQHEKDAKEAALRREKQSVQDARNLLDLASAALEEALAKHRAAGKKDDGSKEQLCDGSVSPLDAVGDGSVGGSDHESKAAAGETSTEPQTSRATSSRVVATRAGDPLMSGGIDKIPYSSSSSSSIRSSSSSSSSMRSSLRALLPTGPPADGASRRSELESLRLESSALLLRYARAQSKGILGMGVTSEVSEVAASVGSAASAVEEASSHDGAPARGGTDEPGPSHRQTTAAPDTELAPAQPQAKVQADPAASHAEDGDLPSNEQRHALADAVAERVHSSHHHSWVSMSRNSAIEALALVAERVASGCSALQGQGPGGRAGAGQRHAEWLGPMVAGQLALSCSAPMESAPVGTPRSSTSGRTGGLLAVRGARGGSAAGQLLLPEDALASQSSARRTTRRVQRAREQGLQGRVRGRVLSGRKRGRSNGGPLGTKTRVVQAAGWGGRDAAEGEGEGGREGVGVGVGQDSRVRGAVAPVPLGGEGKDGGQDTGSEATAGSVPGLKVQGTDVQGAGVDGGSLEAALLAVQGRLGDRMTGYRMGLEGESASVSSEDSIMLGGQGEPPRAPPNSPVSVQGV